jgi:hypothetical protein
VAISLAPGRLALERRSRGLWRRVLASAELAVPAGAGGEPGPALERLADALADRRWHGGLARVVVADLPWVRYAVVPWPGARLDAAGRLAHARCVLADACGEAVAGWEVTLSDAPPGRACVACAVQPALRPAIEAALAPARLKLVSLQPRLVAAYQAWRRRLAAEDAWFVRVDDGALAAVHLARGAWERVHLARLSPDWGVELARLQAFARLTRLAGGPGPMYVDAPASMRDAAPGAGIEWLEAPGGAGAGHLAAAGRGVTP